MVQRMRLMNVVYHFLKNNPQVTLSVWWDADEQVYTAQLAGERWLEGKVELQRRDRSPDKAVEAALKVMGVDVARGY